MSTATSAWAHGLATVSTDSATEGSVLDVWFPPPPLGERPADDEAPRELVEATGSDHARRIRREVVTVEIADLAAAPTTTAEVWLRLHLLSHRLVRPHGVSMDGVFGKLTNVVWTSAGPCAVEDFEMARARMKARQGVGNMIACAVRVIGDGGVSTMVSTAIVVAPS